MVRCFFFSILSGFLFAISWPEKGIPLFIFFSFIPLFEVEHFISTRVRIRRKSWWVFLCSYLAFFTWNILTTWWLFNSLDPSGKKSLPAVLLPNLCNALFMALVFLLYHEYKKRQGMRWGLLFFSVLWIGFEKLHLEWELSWPWLSLGNVFSEWNQLVQWYDITGILGGSLWVLLANTFGFYSLVLCRAEKKRNRLAKSALVFLLVLLLPMFISVVRYRNLSARASGSVKALLIQPKVDPYREKYQRDSSEMLSEILSISEAYSKEKIDIYLAPETSVTGSINEQYFAANFLVKAVRSFLSDHQQGAFVLGSMTHRAYPESKKTIFSRYNAHTGSWQEDYNSALGIGIDQEIEVHHKAKLVPGVEIFPYMKLFKPLIGNMMFDFGGSVHSLSYDKTREPFKNLPGQVVLAPIICYESIYGEFVADYVKNGANLLGIITNDSWWGDSPGHRQLLSYAKLRAIETRREVLRAANSGISAHIDIRGKLLQSLPYETKGALVVEANLYEGETFYVKYGDGIARIAICILCFLVLRVLFHPKKAAHLHS